MSRTTIFFSISHKGNRIAMFLGKMYIIRSRRYKTIPNVACCKLRIYDNMDIIELSSIISFTLTELQSSLK
jgi:hypothetical protein